jgi:DNA mismatch repair protein MutS2
VSSGLLAHLVRVGFDSALPGKFRWELFGSAVVQAATGEKTLSEPEIPDLLSPLAMARVDMRELERALGFAFASAGSDVALNEQLAQANLPFSTWDPECFSHDLYLPSLIEQLRKLTLRGQVFELHAGHLLRVLSHPPADIGVTRFRQHILHELLHVQGMEGAFEELYVRLQALRMLLRDSGLGFRLDANRRRIDILEAAKAVIEHMAGAFTGAQSGLSRLSRFAEHMQKSEGYTRLVKILELDDGNASLEARLRIGYEGQLRHFEIVRISEQTLNPFYASRMGRIFRKLVLLYRGYRFSDHEVLNCFVDEVFAGVSRELTFLFQLLADMEFYLAALRFRALSQEQGLEVCLPELSTATPFDAACPRELVGLFNPLLLTASSRPVPCALRHDRHTDPVILTGPNSGGKTRLLQALSLTQLLAQSGFFVPAAHARLVWAHGMFLSISEQPNAEQREGRLGMELLRIRRVFESMRFGAFVVMDELCSGTNPAEGEEIFRMVLDLLRELHPQAFISTHFLQFAGRLSAESDGRRSFLQVELDARNLPSYQFIPGVASASLAQETAARLGVTREELTALVDRQRRAQVALSGPASVAPPRHSSPALVGHEREARPARDGTRH